MGRLWLFFIPDPTHTFILFTPLPIKIVNPNTAAYLSSAEIY
jgi:hypothetical protein